MQYVNNKKKMLAGNIQTTKKEVDTSYDILKKGY